MSIDPLTATRGGRTRAVGALVFARRRANWLYVPALAVFALFTVYPLVNGFVLSLTNWNGYSPGRSFIGLDNYVRMLGDPIVGTALGNTFIYGIGSTVLQQIMGLALALALDRAIRGRSIARAIIYLPVLVSPVVMGTMYYLLFSYRYGGAQRHRRRARRREGRLAQRRRHCDHDHRDRELPAVRRHLDGDLPGRPAVDPDRLL